MPLSSLTQLNVWNMALDHLIEHPLSSTSEDSTYARWLGRNEDNLRDAFLRRYTWNFSIVNTELTAMDSVTVPYRWGYQYSLPEGCLRLLPLVKEGDWGAAPVPHKVVGKSAYLETITGSPPADFDSMTFIWCNDAGPLEVSYIDRVDDYAYWDPLAVDLFALTTAIRMTMRFSNKATLRDRLLAEAAEVAKVAYGVDAMEGTPEPVEQHNVVDARFW